MIKHIPNLFTAGNLFLGCLAIVSALDGQLTTAAWYIGIAGILDFFDGFIARALKVSGELGKQLDSLADVVSFGVAPGMIFYNLHQEYLVFTSAFIQFVPLLVVISYLPFLIPVFSGYRLAKFNIDTRQTHSFIGVPTPANALFIASLPFVISSGPAWASDLIISTPFLILFPIVSSYLLISELPLFALKFKSFGFNQNRVRYAFLITCALLILLLNYTGISVSILLYVALSLILHLTKYEI